jgi:hypothetical protein
MLTVFFNYKGIVCYEYAPHGQGINHHFYLQVSWHLHDAVHCKWLKKQESGKFTMTMNLPT